MEWKELISNSLPLLGVIIGGLITSATNYFNNRREDKRFELKLEHENKQQLRKDKLNRLYQILIPIIEIYEQSDTTKEQMFKYDVRTFGSGLEAQNIKTLKKIIKENKKFMSLELIKTYYKVEAEYDFALERERITEKIWQIEHEGGQAADFVFDNEKIFIDKVEKEAKKIEEKYNK